MNKKTRFAFTLLFIFLILTISGCQGNTEPITVHRPSIITSKQWVEQKTIIQYTSTKKLSMTPSITNELDLDGTLLLIAEIDTNLGPRLYKLNADGNNLEMLSKDDIISVRYAEWSPNGEMIAFLPFSKSIDTHGFPDGEALKVINSNGSGLKTLVSKGYLGGYSGYDDDISWSPDGTRIIYSDLIANNKGDLFLVWMDGSKKRLTNSTSFKSNPKWISTTEVVYYSYDENGKSEVNIMDVDSNNNIRVVDLPKGYKIESLDTHCGKWILSKGESIYLMDINDTFPQLVAKISKGELRNIKWSPDCMKIAYVSEKLAILDLDQKRTIEFPNLDMGEPYWSPESKRIAYESSSYIYILNSDGSRNRRIFSAKGLNLMGWQPVPL